MTVFEEFRRPPGERSEQQPWLAVDDPRVEMRRRHRRRTDRGQAVDLRPVLRGDRGIATAQELSGDRKAAKSLGFGDAGLLQEPQSLSAGTDEDEFRFQLSVFTDAAIAKFQCPAAVTLARQLADLVAEQRGCPVAYGVADELSTESTEVDVGAVGGPIERQGFGEVALSGHQRQPAGEFVGVVDPFGAGKQRITGQRVPASAQVVDALRTLHEAHMRNRVEETA